MYSLRVTCWCYMVTFVIFPVGTMETCTNFTKLASVYKCTNFTDTRLNWNETVTQPCRKESIVIPGQFTSQAAYIASRNLSSVDNITLLLQENPSTEFICFADKVEVISLDWNLENRTKMLEPRQFNEVNQVSNMRHNYSYFTKSAHFYDATSGTYYRPKTDYCVESISDKKINLQVCKVDKDCANSIGSNTLCLPKCCALDETLFLPYISCERLPEDDDIIPSLEPRIYQSPQSPHEKGNFKPRLLYQMARLPSRCDTVNLNATHIRTFFKMIEAYSGVGPTTFKSENIKMILPLNREEGNIRLVTFNIAKRKWELLTAKNFCVDSLWSESMDKLEYKENLDNFVVIYCDDDQPTNNDEMELNIWYGIAIIVFGIIGLLLVLIFIPTTIVVYVSLWDKLNLHGLTILSYAGSMLLGVFVIVPASLYPVIADMELTEANNERDTVCHVLAILSHYSDLSMEMWLTVMNCDLWTTFFIIRAVDKQLKNWKRFGIYSAVGWGLPALLVTACVILDELYRDPRTEVPVPDYGKRECDVSPEFQREYVFAPKACLLVINILLCCMTMWIIIKVRRETSQAFNNGDTAVNKNVYGVKLFVKLFVLMGGLYFFDFVQWFYFYEHSETVMSVAWDFLRVICNVLLLFYLFCLNPKIIGQIREKYPRVADKLDPLLKRFG